MRYSCILLVLAVAGCQTCRTAFYGSPGCSSCGSAPAASRFAPRPQIAQAPPPVRETPRPPMAAVDPPAEETPRPPVAAVDPPAGDPPARLGEPRVKVESKAVPDASIPKPDDAVPPPIDLPGFVAARPGVASGLQPFPDGQEWLARKGYKTVLHLRAPGDDTAAAQRQFEKKGMTYVSLEVSPATLTQEKADEFTRLVTDAKTQPLFVYDKDGSAAGALWYLHWRQHLKADDETAKKEAARLGLRADEEEHKAMWVAVQALLKKAAP